MIKLHYRVQFLSPAFLGGADQAGEWRTPPFKNLLRQWWRVTRAMDSGYTMDENQLREEEGLLFGHASPDIGGKATGKAVSARQSLIRMRLDCWQPGTERQVRMGEVRHPEVGDGGRQVDAALYLGYGAIIHSKVTRQPELKAKAAIQADAEANFSLALPDTAVDSIRRAIDLMHLYGTVGGRSRNGWGSLAVEPLDRDGQEDPPVVVPTRPWQTALQQKWAASVAVFEEVPCIWQTTSMGSWKEVMKHLAKIKIDLRTGEFPLADVGTNLSHPVGRHWLSYPLTHHDVRAWSGLRLPNSLRFKLRRLKDGRMVGVIFHMPVFPPPDFEPRGAVIESVWEKVYRFLDKPTNGLFRIPI